MIRESSSLPRTKPAKISSTFRAPRSTHWALVRENSPQITFLE